MARKNLWFIRAVLRVAAMIVKAPGITLAARLRDYRRIASPLFAYPVLAIIWLEVIAAFCRNVGPRLAHLSPAGMAVADQPCGYPQCDFSVFWPAGLLARMGNTGAIYDPARFQAVRQQLFSPAVGPLDWYYPPPALLTAIPISYLPFETGFFVWTLALVLFGVFLLRLARLPWLVICCAMLSPAALWNDQLGQFGVFTGCAWVGFLLLADEAPLAAGAVLALLVLKPQAGVLAPAVLLGRRYGRALAACGLTVAAILGATTGIVGVQAWRDFFAFGLAASHQLLENPGLSGSTKFGVSVFWMLRSFGGGMPAAYAGQLLAAIAAFALTWVIWRRKNFDRAGRMALTVFLALLVTPYGYTDDMVGWSIALAALARRRGWRIDPLDALFWLWPALSPLVFERTGLLVTPLVVVTAVIRNWARAAPLPAALPAGAG